MVNFTDTAIADLEQFVPEPEQQESLVVAIDARLSIFPARFGPCPSMGALARSYSDGMFTIVYDLEANGEVWVRHILPSRGRQVAALFGRR